MHRLRLPDHVMDDLETRWVLTQIDDRNPEEKIFWFGRLGTEYVDAESVKVRAQDATEAWFKIRHVELLAKDAGKLRSLTAEDVINCTPRYLSYVEEFVDKSIDMGVPYTSAGKATAVMILVDRIRMLELEIEHLREKALS